MKGLLRPRLPSDPLGIGMSCPELHVCTRMHVGGPICWTGAPGTCSVHILPPGCVCVCVCVCVCMCRRGLSDGREPWGPAQCT